MAVYRDTLEFPSGDEKWLEEDSQIRLLRAVTKGELVVLPTDTVYGIGADPFSHSAVGRLLGAKGRDQTMPPPVLGGLCEELLSLLDFTSLEQRDTVEQLAREFWPGPLTIIAPSKAQFGWDTESVNGTIAVRMPGSDLAISALRVTGPLAVTSANRTGMPAARTLDEAREYFGDEVSVYIDGGASPLGRPSTIVDCSRSAPRVIRAGGVTAKQIEDLLESK